MNSALWFVLNNNLVPHSVVRQMAPSENIAVRNIGARAAAGRRRANELACPAVARVSCSRRGPAPTRRSDAPGKPFSVMKPTTPDQYLASLPDDRRAAMLALHAAIRKAVPKLTSELTSSRSAMKPLWPGFPSERAACAAGSSDGFAVRRPG